MKEYLIKNWKGLGLLLVISALILYNVVLYKNNLVKDKKIAVAEHNLKAANDTIRIVKDRVNKDEYNKLAYLTNSVNTLAKMNEELAKEIKNIKGNVQTIIQGEVKIKEVPVPFIVKAELVDSTVIARFKYDTTYSPGNFRKLSGYTTFNLKDHTVSGQKELDEIGVKLTTGIKNLDKGKPEIFLKSDYPGFSVTSLEGAVLDPKLFKPKNKTPLITPVFYVGWSPVNYNLQNKNLTFSANNLNIGFGVGFNLLKITGIKK